MSKLPNEILNQVFGDSRSPEISFVKLLRVQDDYGVIEFDWRDQPIFTEATFPRFDPASMKLGPFEEMNEEHFRRRRRVEDWWNKRRPTSAPFHPQAPLRWTNAAARRISFGENPVVLPIQMGLPDELKHKEGDYLMTTPEFDVLKRSQLILNPTLDILCLQVGDLSDHFPEVPSPDGCKHVIQVSAAHPGTSRISKLAVEFHGPTTREWCRYCIERFDNGGHKSAGVLAHSPEDCHRALPVRRCEQPCNECDDCEEYAVTFRPHNGIYDLLDEFVGVRSLFLIDWAYESVGTEPDPSTAYASNGEYDFFLVERGAGQERWRAERPCPFESLYCAESIEQGFKWELESEEAVLMKKLNELNDKLADLDDPKEESSRKTLKLKKDARKLTQRLAAPRSKEPFRCQVLAAVKKKKSSAEENSTESVAGSSDQAKKRRRDGSEHDCELRAKRRA
ncbi:unnamed protein product [Clonostachys rhizophaga]|uniref:Uncharacterized protein n=1 Tax=Clonostachys rhizophaga TaxID=160324 RepID=A0A9N9YMF6_9HYPO|nr:unnamed protein product [Clonostachys rhizophaga]